MEPGFCFSQSGADPQLGIVAAPRGVAQLAAR